MSCQILGSSTLNFIMWHTWINLTSKCIVQETNHQLSPKKQIWSIHWFLVVTNFLSSNCKLEFYCILDQEDWILDKHSYKRVQREWRVPLLGGVTRDSGTHCRWIYRFGSSSCSTILLGLKTLRKIFSPHRSSLQKQSHMSTTEIMSLDPKCW